MNVEVVQSLTLSRILPGMTGVANTQIEDFNKAEPTKFFEVSFKNVSSSVPGCREKGNVIVKLQKQELKPI